jgi:RNA-directed DNA polymerase
VSDQIIVVLKGYESSKERRVWVIQCSSPKQPIGQIRRKDQMDQHKGKTVPIEYSQVVEAYRKARNGGKAAGVDGQSWEKFVEQLDDNLHIIHSRLASGSYHPQPVREVEIPKKDGKKRKLGIPTLRDRVAQQVVKDYMEKQIDKLFHENSYGYRPQKSAHQALAQVRQNCFDQDWVIDMDISKFFDEINHEVMLKAVKHVMQERWVAMYVKRWLEMPVQKSDGTIQPKEGKGTPQGGVISPLLANLYLHFTLDKWLEINFPHVAFVRYADDIVVHCNSQSEAETVLEAIRGRLKEVGLQIKEEKTKIAYCKDYKRKGEFENVKFDFLGFSYQPRVRKSYHGGTFLAFTAEISATNQNKMRDEIRSVINQQNTTLEMSHLAGALNPKIRGWINYYGLYSKRYLRKALLRIDSRLIAWIRKKYRLQTKKAAAKLITIRKTNPELFYHWSKGYYLLE